MKYTSEQIELIDNVFSFFIAYHVHLTEKRYPSSSLFSKLFNVNEDLAQFAINEICNIGHDIGILTAQKFNSGDFVVVSVDKTKCLTFQDQGGFKDLFKSHLETKNADVVRQILSDKKMTTEIEVLEFQKGLGKKLLIWGLVVSIISIFSSIVTSVFITNKDKQSQPIDTVVLKAQMQKIEQRLQALEYRKPLDTIPKK